METTKRVVIVTDGSPEVCSLADLVGAELKDQGVTRLRAPDFEGKDILPADVLVLGCGEPRPASFSYLEEFLNHVNLSGRRCGFIGAGKPEIEDYLAAMVRDSGLAPVKRVLDSPQAGQLKSFAGDLLG